ncbi:hypothetical protein ACFL7M_18185 [Thermodesulfobacteriota bacterium]
MGVKADYEMRPLSDDIWKRMKKIRRDHWMHTWVAQEEGGICVTGFAWQFQPILAGFGSFGSPSMGTGFIRAARLGTAPEGLRKYVDIVTSSNNLHVSKRASLGKYSFLDNSGNVMLYSIEK